MPKIYDPIKEMKKKALGALMGAKKALAKVGTIFKDEEAPIPSTSVWTTGRKRR